MHQGVDLMLSLNCVHVNPNLILTQHLVNRLVRRE